ncbi:MULTISPECIES: universal stress protein [unclassified Modicisalibacter]|uniref:universal stress protein n=1 Tax=unclassified Modicisalibacter TaxID=2679913 RepID=UPI001CCD141F|nr:MULTISPECIES: universal stress protein [unclassified Modicisalibacter]MBZ9560058.1 universal stress protein [Modicisalibacter sp. R2A 31.J]MBZ9575967.1 universal stress protein [Modicisalibacter sp. MOD 31.J]
MFKTIMVPVDGSEQAKLALEVACKLAANDQAKLHILHIPERLAHDNVLVWGVGAVNLEAPEEEVERAGHEMLEAAKQAAAEHGATDVEGSVHQGDPARVILERAKSLGVDTIVMGSRGLSDIRGLMVGSVSHKVSHAAPCHVITVH